MAEKHPKGTVLGRLKSEMIASLDVFRWESRDSLA